MTNETNVRNKPLDAEAVAKAVAERFDETLRDIQDAEAFYRRRHDTSPLLGLLRDILRKHGLEPFA